MEKKIVLGDRSSLSLTPIKYQWAFDYFNVMSDNFWKPHIVNMVKDSVQYAKELTSNEKHVLHSVLGYLSTADVVAMRNISSGIAEKVTAVEVEMVINTITFQEAIHTLSYQHILDSVSIRRDKQDEIYNYYKTNKTIADKILYSNNIIDKMLMSTFTDTDSEGFYNFIHGYWFFSQIFEGCLFINGFNPILSMLKNNLMAGTGTQLNLIRQDEELHKAFGAKFITEVCKEHNYKLDEEYCIKMMMDVSVLEEAYINDIMPEGLRGYSVEDHMGNHKFLCNRRMKHFGFKQVFNRVKKLRWHDADNTIKREANFFETNSTEYTAESDIMSTF